MNEDGITYLKLQRQHIIEPVSVHDYDEFFKLMSPVQTLFWIEPGSPPEMQYRCAFDDAATNDYYRRERKILKGRFQGGNVGYVFYEDFPIYMAAFRKEIKFYTENEEIVLNILKREGPMEIDLIKEISGLLSKEISKALQRLQKAFMVYEDQVDKGRDRAFYIIEDEFYDMDFDKYSREDGIDHVVTQFIYQNVWVDAKMIKSFTKFTNKDIDFCIERLLERKVITRYQKDNMDPVDENPEGLNAMDSYVLVQDRITIQSVMNDIAGGVVSIPKKILVLDLNDYLVKSNELYLKERFSSSEYKTLHYIYADKEIIGRVLGYFRFGPNDLEDVEIDIECDYDKQRIIEAVELVYEGQETKLKRFNGELLPD